MIEIKKISNGILLTNKYGEITYYDSCQSLFEYLLNHFEGKTKHFGGDSYGYVHVFKHPNEVVVSPQGLKPA